jgi:hypothetical protein
VTAAGDFPGRRVLLAALAYFALVFGAGFALGAIRTLWVVPAIGVRAAELLETPFMVAISFLAARWIVRRLSVPAAAGARLGMGALALVLLLGAEFGFVLSLRGMTLEEYFATRDPVSGTAYYLALLAYAAFPLCVARR